MFLDSVLGKTLAPRGKTPKARAPADAGGRFSAMSKRGRLLFALYEKRIARTK